jgi:DNA-binding response OmpR family regulator
MVGRPARRLYASLLGAWWWLGVRSRPLGVVVRHKVLLVDDDPDMIDMLTFLVGRTGMVALPARDVPSALMLFETEHPDLALVDVGLGPWSGFDLVTQLRERSEMPIILLTARASDDDKVRGLEAGADDYLVKPFSHRELIARIRAHLRRGRTQDDERTDSVVLRAGPLLMNVAQHSAAKEGRSLNLTATEFRLLRYLMDRASTVVQTGAILKEIWGHDDPGAREVLRVTLYRLRRKLEDDPSAPRLLHTIPGVGLMLVPQSTEPVVEPTAS